MATNANPVYTAYTASIMNCLYSQHYEQGDCETSDNYCGHTGLYKGSIYNVSFSPCSFMVTLWRECHSNMSAMG